MTKLNAIQKHILKIAVAHAEKYEVDQPITVLSERSMEYVDEFAAAQRKYFKAMNELVTCSLITRKNDGFAYITHYGRVREALAA
jgi:hypothetical protein